MGADDADLDGSDPQGPMRTLQVLEALAGMEQPAGLATIAASMNLSKSKAYRALRALQDQGFVDHAGRSGYRLGSRSVALASLIGPRPVLLWTARPVLARLAAIAGELVTLHLRSGAHRVLVIAAEAPSSPLRGAVMLGERAPLTSGCSGTAILAFLSPAESAAVIKNRPRGSRRPSPGMLARIRADGFAMSFSENHVGLNGIAAPILDPVDSCPLGCVVIAGPEGRLPEPALRRLARPLSIACSELAPRLANVLGPNSSERLTALDVTIQGLLEV